MEIQIIPLLFVVLYLVGMLIVGFVVGRTKINNSRDYLVAGRRQGLFMVAFSLSANNIGGGSTVGLAQKAFGDWGLSAIWYVLAAAIAMIPLAFFAPKIRKTMAITIPEVVGRRFGKFSSNFTAILSVLSLFCLTSSQIAASGGIIAALLPSIPLNVCLLVAGVCKLLGSNLEALLGAASYKYRNAVRKLYNLRITEPAGARNDNLIPGIENRLEDVGQGMLSSVAYDNLLRRILEVIALCKLLADCLAKLGHTGCGGVFGKAAVQSFHGGIANVFGGIKVRLTGTETDNVDSLGAKFLGFCCDGERGGRLDGHSLDRQ